MSLNLYNEAIVEAKQLRELAEQNAKNKIIKAITPKIKKLIEQQLSFEPLINGLVDKYYLPWIFRGM